ncbi:hypothetical protein ABE527_10850 [Brucella sp. TWI432]
MNNFDLRFLGIPDIQNMLTARPNMVPMNMLTGEPAQPTVDLTQTGSTPSKETVPEGGIFPSQPPQGNISAPVAVGMNDLNYFPPQPDANAAPITQQDYQASLRHLQPQNAPQQPAQASSDTSGGLDVGNFAAFLQGLGRGNGVLSAIGGGLGAVQERKQENQTVKYLTSQGISEGEAQIISRNPQAVVQVLQNIRKGVDPKTNLELQKLGFEVDAARQKAQSGNLINTGGGSIYNSSTGEWMTAPNGGGKDTPDIQNYKFAKDNGYTGSFTDFQTEKTRAAKRATIGGATIDFEGLPMVSTDPNTGRPDAIAQNEFLRSLPRGTATLVKKVANYEMPITSVTSLRAGERQQLAQLVGMYDPSFDATQSTSRTQTRKDYSTGEMAKLASSTNLAIQHMAGMVDEHAKLDNGDYPAWNSVANTFSRQTGGAAQQGFETFKLGVAEELGKAFHGTGAVPVEAVKEWKAAISSSSSPDQLKAAVTSALHMLAARTETYNQRYEQSMGGNQAPGFLTKSSVAALQKMGIDPAELDPRFADKEAAFTPNGAGARQSGNINGYKIERVN